MKMRKYNKTKQNKTTENTWLYPVWIKGLYYINFILLKLEYGSKNSYDTKFLEKNRLLHSKFFMVFTFICCSINLLVCVWHPDLHPFVVCLFFNETN